MTAGEPRPFDVCAELPSGTTLLEASAGTGKTFTIATLATRLVAEGAAELGELMLVTFSRTATQELRERVREHMLSVHRRLGEPVRARTGPDDVARLLASADDGLVAERRRRLHRALSAFDAATIATTHSFCQQMLAGLGVAGDADPDLQFLDRADELVTEVVDDLYLRKYALAGSEPPRLTYPAACDVARAAVSDRHAAIVPGDPAAGSRPAERVGIATAARAEVEARKRRRRLIDYDDLLVRVQTALTEPRTAEAAAARIGGRYRYVLVDEFQDTDPVQWDILRRAFAGRTVLVLIGDPKQAIYGFRGADVYAYLAAAGTATAHRTLARNWRSDAALLDGLDALLGGAALGDPAIVVRPVSAAHPTRRLHGPAVGAPLRFRVVAEASVPHRSGRRPRVADVRPFIADDLAGEVVRLLAGGATLRLDGAEGAVGAGDLAVLVRTNDQAALVRDRLAARGVPAVLTGSRSVFLTRAASDWLVLLRALEQPHRSGLVRAAALGPFLGWTAARLATSTDAELDGLGQRLRGWREVAAGRGIAAMLEKISSTERLPERMLARAGGERDLTDLRHIGQALHDAAVNGHLGLSALVDWQLHQMAEARQDPSEERSRRLDTDAGAVQVVTIYASKGLQFPVVYVPFAWDRFRPNDPTALRLHDEGGHRLLDVGGPGDPGYGERLARARAEQDGEELRLLYVAVTRARCQVVAWWAPTATTQGSALHRLLFGERGADGWPPAEAPVPDDAEAGDRLLRWAAAAPAGSVSVEAASAAPPTSWRRPDAPPAQLAAASLDRELDLAWRRTSYTALTASLHGVPASPAGVGSEPEESERADEPAVPEPALGPAAGGEARLRDWVSPMADLPTGTAFGTLVHRVLQLTDPAAADLDGSLREAAAAAAAERLAPAADPDLLAAALRPALETPLGALAGDRPLRAIPAADRLSELEFELPLDGGDSARPPAATLADVAGLLGRTLPAGDPLAGYPDALSAAGLGGELLRGYLTGSLDAVLRVPDATGRPRYLVVDYKTNWLGDPAATGSGRLSAWHYRPAALRAAMVRAHYPLQALLYTVALHRYLRWRQPGYDPAVHLGGVLYLFVRGMCGPAVPAIGGDPPGVFGWRPPAGLVDELSELLDRGAR